MGQFIAYESNILAIHQNCWFAATAAAAFTIVVVVGTGGLKVRKIKKYFSDWINAVHECVDVAFERKGTCWFLKIEA